MINLFDLWQKETQLNLSQSDVMVFDCDQTLINGDIGEACLRLALSERWVISHDAWWAHFIDAGFPLTEVKAWRNAYEQESDHESHTSLAETLWLAYQQLCELDVHSAYVYAARLVYQHQPAEVIALVERALNSDSTVSFRPTMSAFVQEIQKQAKVWVVSSSQASLVRVIADYYQIPNQQVIGIDFTLDSQQAFTDQLILPAPIGAQKVDALQLFCSKIPLMMAGDSKHDLPLMKYSKSGLFIDHHRSQELTEMALNQGVIRVSAQRL